MTTIELESALASAQRAVQSGQVGTAETLCRAVLKSDPSNARALYMLGILLSNSGRKDDALASFNALLKVDPRSVEALNWTAMLLRELGRLDESREISGRAIAIDANSPTAHFNEGMAYLHLDRAAEAVASFQKAVSLRPDFPNYVYHLGLAWKKLNKDTEARRCFRKVVALAPTFAPALLELTELAERSSDWLEMERCARALLAQDPNSGLAALYVGTACAQLNKIEEARTHLKRAIALDPDLSRAYEGLALTYQGAGDFEQAKKILKEAMDRLPNSGGIVAQYVDFQKLKEEDRPFVDEIAAKAERSDIEPIQLSFFHLALGKAYGDLGDYEASMKHFAEGHRLQLLALPDRFSEKAHQETRDRIISTFNKEFFLRNRSVGNHSDLPIFIVGMIRSGTTLMEQILSAHPDVGAAGEQYFWLDYGEEAIDFNSRRMIPDKTADLARRYLSILKSYAGDKPHITDKNPLNVLLVGQLHTIFPNARFIHMRRDPIDNCLSIWITRTGVPAPYANRMEDIAFVYEQYMRLVRHWRKEMPADRYMEVRYEDLVENREEVLQRLLPFCGLEWNDACLEHEKNQRMVTTPSLWQVRQPIYKTSVQRWKRYEPWIGPFLHLADKA